MKNLLQSYVRELCFLCFLRCISTLDFLVFTNFSKFPCPPTPSSSLCLVFSPFIYLYVCVRGSLSICVGTFHVKELDEFMQPITTRSEKVIPTYWQIL